MEKYRVTFSAVWKQNVVKLHGKAREEGRLEIAKLAFAELMRALEANPTALGETVYHLRTLGLRMNHVVRVPWSLHFAIDEERRLVYVGLVQLLSKPAK